MLSLLHRGCCFYFLLLIILVNCHSVFMDSDDEVIAVTLDSVKYNSIFDVLLNSTVPRIVENNVTVNRNDIIPQTIPPESLGDALEGNNTPEPVFVQNITENPLVLEPSTLKPVELTTPKSVATKNSTCHSECVSSLNQTTFRRDPEDYLLQKGSSLSLECSLPLNVNFTASITWLFQGICPPEPQCSLTTQETLPSCPNFAFRNHFVDVNYTAGYLKEVLILEELNQKDSGNYICQVELICCSGSHVMDRSIETEQPIIVYYENYQLEVGILFGVIVALVLLVVLGTFLQNRHRQRRFTVNLLEVKRPVLDDVLHVPILERRDSFDDSDQEWDDDKG